MPKRTTLSDVRGLVAQLQRLSRLASASGTVAITDVTGLSAALTAKADASHGHVAGDITDLDDVLNEYVTAAEPTAALSTLTIENRTDDPASPATGRIWLRTDL